MLNILKIRDQKERKKLDIPSEIDILIDVFIENERI